MKSKYAYPEHNYDYNACQKLDGFITICIPYIKTVSTKNSIYNYSYLAPSRVGLLLNSLYLFEKQTWWVLHMKPMLKQEYITAEAPDPFERIPVSGYIPRSIKGTRSISR